ncbi:MAG: hypothetical protein ACYTAO_04545, partial [Planctomycetota bacterium]
MKSARNIEKSIERLAVESSDRIHERVLDKLLTRFDKSKKQAAAEQANVRRIMLWRRVCYMAAALLV